MNGGNDVSINYNLFAFSKPQKGTKNRKKMRVSETTYQEVKNACKGKCALCGTTQNLHCHHILYRSERKDLIDDPKNLIMLCEKHHLEVHSNKRYWQPILIDLRKGLENERCED